MLVTKGKSLTKFHAITHPSMPNYAAIVAGDFFGLANEVLQGWDSRGTRSEFQYDELLRPVAVFEHFVTQPPRCAAATRASGACQRSSPTDGADESSRP